MEDMQAARNLAAKILDTNGVPVNFGEGVPVNSKEGGPKDDSEEGVKRLLDDAVGDSVPSASPEVEVPNFDPDFVPVSDLKPRRKKKTEVENLEIDLKGWNYTNLSPLIESLVSDNLPPHKDEDGADSKNEQLSSEQSDSDLYLNFNETDSFNDCVILV